MSERSVGVDHDFKQILEWSKAGDQLKFEHEPGKFKELTPRQVKQLDYWSTASYRLAEQMNKKAVAEAEMPSFMAGAVVSQAASPTERLRVEGKRPGMHYYWAAPHEFRRKIREGYKAVEGDEVETFASRVGTVHTVGEKGTEELVLMKIPEETFEAREEKHRAVSRARATGRTIENTAVAEMEKAGGLPYEEDENDRRGWKELEQP